MTRQPNVSVIIATYNRKEFLRLALLSYNLQTYKNFDVIVASDGSSDGTEAMIEEIMDDLGYPVQYICQEDIGFRKALILNKAVALSDSQYLIFADDDCIAPAGYIENHVKRLGPDKVVVGKYFKIKGDRKHLFTQDNIRSGRYENAVGIRDLVYLFYRKIQYRLYFLTRNRKRPKLMGGNFSVSRQALVSVNGFDCDFVGWGYEDDDIRNRLVRSGCSLEEVVMNGYNFNLGYEGNTTPRQTTQDKVFQQKKMAYSLDRPWFCENGLDRI